MKKSATIVVDLGFGDAGKGTTIDYLARRGGVSAVVRFNGGAQARHFVVTPDGRTHGFSQFGSATFVPGVQTFLSRYVLVDLLELAKEAELLAGLSCRNALARVAVDERAIVVTPMHRSINRLRELARGAGKHGSCGMGIGEAMAASIEHPQLTIRVGDLRDKRRLTELLHAQQLFFARCSETIMPYDKQIRVMSDSAILHYPDSLSEVASVMCEVGKEVRIVPSTHLSRLAQQGSLLFEGAQGVLLDEWRGFHPHTTWSTTTPENARTLLAEIGYTHPTKTLGVMRAYHTRHGAGPFPTEAAGLAKYFHDKNNGTHEWQGAFRVGHLDMVLLRYALTVSGGVDGLVLTHLDQYQRIAENSRQHVCVAYELEGGKRVYNLPINPHLTDLVWQERLTENVSGARPVYDTLGVGASLVEYLERQLGTPVVIGSYGPSAGDKTLLRPF